MLEKLLPFHGVAIQCGARVTGYRDGILTATVGEETKTFPADSVVLCVGYRSESALYQTIAKKVDECYLLGDARKVANIMYAIWDAFEVANHI